MSKAFTLESSFAPAGDQPQAIHRLVEGLNDGEAGMTLLGVILLWRRKLFENKFFQRLAVISLPLPIIVNELGWMSAEMGRQPWIVYQVPGMKTAEAISPSVSAGEILASIIMFSIIYALLFALWIHLLRRAIRKGPEVAEEVVS